MPTHTHIQTHVNTRLEKFARSDVSSAFPASRASPLPVLRATSEENKRPRMERDVIFPRISVTFAERERERDSSPTKTTVPFIFLLLFFTRRNSLRFNCNPLALLYTTLRPPHYFLSPFLSRLLLPAINSTFIRGIIHLSRETN